VRALQHGLVATRFGDYESVVIGQKVACVDGALPRVAGRGHAARTPCLPVGGMGSAVEREEWVHALIRAQHAASRVDDDFARITADLDDAARKRGSR
jgi:hypothetical protein